MRDLLDFFFSEFRWYRKLGGQWERWQVEGLRDYLWFRSGQVPDDVVGEAIMLEDYTCQPR